MFKIPQNIPNSQRTSNHTCVVPRSQVPIDLAAEVAERLRVLENVLAACIGCKGPTVAAVHDEMQGRAAALRARLRAFEAIAEPSAATGQGCVP